MEERFTSLGEGGGLEVNKDWEEHIVALGVKFLAIVVSLAGIAGLPVLGGELGAPNVLILLVDDLGYGDIGRNGNQVVSSPVLDRLGGESLRVEPFYASPVCATTRASLLTGRDYWRTGVWGVHSGRDYLRLDEKTLAEYYREAGYRTGFIGKWHSGKHGPWLPWRRGFDEAWMAELYNQHDGVVTHNGRKEDFKGWTTDHLGALAGEFMKAESDQPFFLLLSFLAPHEPWEAPEELVAKYRQKGNSEAFATLLAMIEQLDGGIGRVLRDLKELGYEKDTLVVFLSDNGPIGNCSKLGKLDESEMALRNPMGWRGVKGNPWDHAQRVPCWLRWPGVLTAGEAHGPMHITDLFSTLLAAANIEPKPLEGRPFDGRNLWPFLRSGEVLPGGGGFSLPYWEARWEGDETGVLKEPGSLRFEEQTIGWREGSWKWLRAYGNENLYEMTEDGMEMKDWSKEQSVRAEKLKERTMDWWEKMQSEGRAFEAPYFPLGPVENPVDEVAETRNVGHVPAFSGVGVMGGVRVRSHDSIGWEKAGDGQLFRVDVEKAGRYRLRLECRGGRATSEVRARLKDAEVSGSPDGSWWEAIELRRGQQEFELLVTKATDEGVMEVLDGVRFEWVGDK